MREGRQPAVMSTERAAERAATHRSIREHYQEHARQSLETGDYLQAAEKSWGAYAQTVKAIAADHRMRASHHGSIIGVAGELAALAGQSDPEAGDLLRNGLSTARSLHQHFYENDLPDSIVSASSADVGEAIDLLQQMFTSADA